MLISCVFSFYQSPLYIYNICNPHSIHSVKKFSILERIRLIHTHAGESTDVKSYSSHTISSLYMSSINRPQQMLKDDDLKSSISVVQRPPLTDSIKKDSFIYNGIETVDPPGEQRPNTFIHREQFPSFLMISSVKHRQLDYQTDLLIYR